MYPEGHSTKVIVDGLGGILEGEFRPHFFIGVATVVSKLLIQSLPDVAIFGEKDYQQLCVIRKMVRDMDIPVSILGGATVRESDGLAMSSRNVHLGAADRAKAPRLHAALQAVAERLRAGGVQRRERNCRSGILGESNPLPGDFRSGSKDDGPNRGG